ncbi:hypothetical protein HQ533_06050 [Candidatus Woesearchaeota archaeon]|nr:hypothetical protein [Candidatus Woesearchaeota archaeon]
MNEIQLKEELQDIKALIILALQKMKIDNTAIGKALGISKGRVSQLLDKKKYSRK